MIPTGIIANASTASPLLALTGPIGAAIELGSMIGGVGRQARAATLAAQQPGGAPWRSRGTTLDARAAREDKGFAATSLATPLLKEATDVSFLSGIGKVFGAIGSVGDVVHTIGSVIHPAATAAGKAATVAVDAAGSLARGGVATVRAHPVIAAAAGAAAAGAAMGAGGMSLASPAGKAAHIKRVKQALGLHHRRMHVTNTRALHRALRRVKGFERVARRVLQITHHKPVKVHFKFRRKRAA